MLFDFRSHHLNSVFCAKETMKMIAEVGMGHETSLLCRPSGTLKETVFCSQR